MIDVGYKNFIDEKRVRKLYRPETTRAKWLRKEAVAGQVLIDCTQGRKTNSIITLRGGQVVLSSARCTSIVKKLEAAGIVLKTKKTIEA